MNDPQEPYGRGDLDTAQALLLELASNLDYLDAALESAAEVVRDVHFTDMQRDPLRDISLIPDMDDAWHSAADLGRALADFGDTRERLLNAVARLHFDLEKAAEAFDANEYEVRAEYERDNAKRPETVVELLPFENHYDRMDSFEQFAARVDKDPIWTYECGSCAKKFRARNWVGPCDSCFAQSKAAP